MQLSCGCFAKNDSFRTISNRYLASLSVADLSVGLFVDPLWIVIRCWIKPEVSTVLFRHYTSAVGLHRRRHYFQHLLCFRRPVYFHSVSFPLSGHCDHEKMLRAYNFGVVNLLGSFLLDAFAEWWKCRNILFVVTKHNLRFSIVSCLLLLY